MDVCARIYNELSPSGASANKQTMHERTSWRKTQTYCDENRWRFFCYTDGRTDGRETSRPPINFAEAGGIKMHPTERERFTLAWPKSIGFLSTVRPMTVPMNHMQEILWSVEQYFQSQGTDRWTEWQKDRADHNKTLLTESAGGENVFFIF